ncbi:MAG: hypothetical protein KAT90_02905, partial [Gammaproteobacteria bacterium]|nr:hypothetical protein [Gammaproteobacteria bacterium]
WNQVQYTSEQEIYESLSDLVTVTSRTSTGEGKILGTAFPIAASDNHTMFLTANHVIEEGFKNSSHYSEKRNARRLNHIPGPDNEPYELMANWVSQTDDLWCLLALGNKLVQCIATGICLRPPLDMALLILDTSHLEEITKIFQINSNILNVGDEIVITSLITKDNTRDLVARHGVITEVKSNGTLISAPVYRTNIPIEAGASGGPVFKYTGDFDGHKEVVGVITSDISKPEAFNDPSVDGDSYVSIICSASPLQITNTDGEMFTFQEMCKNGFIQDAGSYIQKVKLSYASDGNWVQSFPKPNA